MLTAARRTVWCAAYFCMLATVVCHQQEEPRGMQTDRIFPKKSDANSHETKATETRRRLLSAKEAVAPLQKPGRFLMGIFTISKERERRDLIRKALAMYQDSRICFLGSTDGNLPTAPADGCELIYTFVCGANLEGSTQVVGNSSLPVITKPPADFDASLEPNDITFLNIKENMEDGKTPTWFYFASQIMNSFGLDYTIKCDSDTFVRVDRFFQIAPEYFPRNARSRYAGKMTWSFLRNHTYMEGQFYVLSKDLAELVASMSVKQVNGVVNIEDSDTGYFIMNQNRVVHMIVLRDKHGRLPWRHPLKKANEFNDVLKRESRRLFGNESLY